MKEGYENASMEFDSKQMRPTYRIIFGLPGHSSPLEIASRLGLPEVILRRARELIIQKGPFIDEILKDIEKKRNKLDELQKEAISEMERAKLYREEAQKILAHLKQEELNFRMTKKKRLEKEISELSSRIKEIAKDLRNREDWDFIMKKRKELHEIEEELKVSVLSKPADKRIPITDSFKGDEVEILPLGKRGILLEDPKEKRDGPLRVKIGSLELQIDQKHLSAINSLHRWRIPSKKDKLIDSFTGKPGDVSPVILDIDLRGMSSEDALRELERFLDKAYLRQVKGVKIIHGHGTGTLKKAIREYLKDSSYVSRFSPGEPIDGGDGVTIVTLNSMGG
jgi:DNA mismatch repair protein MutS2